MIDFDRKNQKPAFIVKFIADESEGLKKLRRMTQLKTLMRKPMSLKRETRLPPTRGSFSSEI